jgi:hypothetical protein
MHFDAAHLMMLAAAAQTIVAAVRIEIVRALQANPLHPFQWHRCHIVNPDGYRSQLIGFGMCCAKKRNNMHGNNLRNKGRCAQPDDAAKWSDES